MKTQGVKTFRYGRIEARIKLPSGMGQWPAFWMLGANLPSVGWPASGEIDVMERINTESKIYGTMHWQDHNGQYAKYGGDIATNPTDWHVYAVEWDASAIRWYLDGTRYHEANIQNGVNGTAEFHQDFFLLLNFAIGGNWPGSNIDEFQLPAKMYVDDVRVYSQAGSGWSQQIEAESFTVQSGIQTEACSEGGLNAGWIDPGDWLANGAITFPTGGTYRVEYRVASLNGGGTLSLDLNAGSVALGQLAVPGTGG